MPRRHPFWIAFPGRRAAMGLRWAARGGSTRDRCIFLDREDRCTVYSDRPLACREHPFSLGFSTSGAVEDITLSDVAECLYELDGHLTRRQLARVSRWNERESEAYQARISVWNRQRGTPRTRGAFMKFLDLDWDRAPAKAGRRDPGRGQSADVEPFG